MIPPNYIGIHIMQRNLTHSTPQANRSLDDLMRTYLIPEEIAKAIQNGKLDELKRILNSDEYDINSTYGVLHRTTFLTAAAEMGQLEMVKYLCEERKAKIYDSLLPTSVFYHVNPLAEACKNNHLNVVKYFCEKYKAEELDEYRSGREALLYAISYHRPEIIEYLCNRPRGGYLIHSVLGSVLNSNLDHHDYLYDVSMAKMLLAHKNTYLSTVKLHIESIVEHQEVFESMKKEVMQQINTMKTDNPLYPLAYYFKNWERSHNHFVKIDPSRYIFAFMILNAKTKEQRNRLIQKLLKDDKLHSIWTNSFAVALKRILEWPKLSAISLFNPIMEEKEESVKKSINCSL